MRVRNHEFKFTGAWGKVGRKGERRRKGGCENKCIAGNEGMERDGDGSIAQRGASKVKGTQACHPMPGDPWDAPGPSAPSGIQ